MDAIFVVCKFALLASAAGPRSLCTYQLNLNLDSVLSMSCQAAVNPFPEPQPAFVPSIIDIFFIPIPTYRHVPPQLRFDIAAFRGSYLHHYSTAHPGKHSEPCGPSQNVPYMWLVEGAENRSVRCVPTIADMLTTTPTCT